MPHSPENRECKGTRCDHLWLHNCTCTEKVKEEMLYCDRQEGSKGKECKCICHQEDYSLPSDFPRPPANEGWEKEFDKLIRGADPSDFLGVIGGYLNPEETKSFISQIEKAAYDEGVRTSNSGRKMYELGKKEGIQEAVKSYHATVNK